MIMRLIIQVVAKQYTTQIAIVTSPHRIRPGGIVGSRTNPGGGAGAEGGGGGRTDGRTALMKGAPTPMRKNGGTCP